VTETRTKQINEIDKTLLENYFSLYPSGFIAEKYENLTGKAITPSSIRARVSRLLSIFDEKQITEILGNKFITNIKVIYNRRKTNEK
jgi:flagellar motor switch protein FliG